MNSKSLFLAIPLALACAPSIHAADRMLDACTAEIKKFACDAKSESYAYECLNKHKEQRTKDKGFSRKCFKAYGSYEKTSGKGEPIESHQTDHPEHKG
ncbi:MAG TPA: hypothetical protein VE954_35190 [Oligoflexus sp.]|uniref:hypothetical protein n=1 Tax=Oligoflexus sp. TaxID=1971216 RepID=UPI002D46BBC0|nr:hypothetical protein [Oligoflexus sp.]HYX38378.1 hypothetical protein [Oligoflexus sp.]